jgi:hypothetical protein
MNMATIGSVRKHTCTYEHTRFQSCPLVPRGLSPCHGQKPNAVHAGCKCPDGSHKLLCKLTRRAQNNGLRTPPAGVQREVKPLEQQQAENCSLAASGLALSHDVAPRESCGERSLLNICHDPEA